MSDPSDAGRAGALANAQLWASLRYYDHSPLPQGLPLIFVEWVAGATLGSA